MTLSCDLRRSSSLLVLSNASEEFKLLLILALRKNRVESLSFGPFSFKMKQEAIEATASAARAWPEASGGAVDVPHPRHC